MRVWLISTATFLFPLNHVICEFLYPGSHPEMIERWDIFKHMVYMIIIGMVAASSFCNIDDKNEKWVKLFSYSLILGMIVPCCIDTYRRDRQVHWYDFVFAALAFYGGMKKFIPEWHKKIGISFINLSSVGLCDGNKVYSLLCKNKSK